MRRSALDQLLGPLGGGCVCGVLGVLAGVADGVMLATASLALVFFFGVMDHPHAADFETVLIVTVLVMGPLGGVVGVLVGVVHGFRGSLDLRPSRDLTPGFFARSGLLVAGYAIGGSVLGAVGVAALGAFFAVTGLCYGGGCAGPGPVLRPMPSVNGMPGWIFGLLVGAIVGIFVGTILGVVEGVDKVATKPRSRV